MKMKVWLFNAALLLSLMGAVAVHARSGSGDATETSGGRNVVKEWVYNSDANDHAAGAVVIYTSGGGTYPGVSVTTTTSANSGLVAGVVVDRTLPGNGWGFIQVTGYCATVNVDFDVTAGDTLVTSTTSAKAQPITVAQSTGTASGQTQAMGKMGISLETSTAHSTVKAVLFR